MTRSLVFDVRGRPAPQGSKTPIIVWSGGKRGVGEPRAVLVEGRDKAARDRFKVWRAAIATAARAEAAGVKMLGPVQIGVVFRLTKPRTVTRDWPSVPPDLDKLVRAVLDSLTGTAIADDGQVVKLLAEKRYCRPGEAEGAVVTISART